MTLPSPTQFLSEALAIKGEDIKGSGTPAAGGVGGVSQKSPIKPTEKETAQAKVSKEFRALLSHYCAETLAIELAQVKWGALATRLGTHPDYLAEAAFAMNEDGSFWNDVLQYRIRKAHANSVFRNTGWERLESMAVNKLVELAERNLIRDPGELLAVAAAARRANTQQESGGGNSGPSVTVNIGDSAMTENGLPAAGSKMTIDLSPRLANSLQKRQEKQEGPRVIDGDMLSAGDLRGLLQEQLANKETVNESGE